MRWWRDPLWLFLVSGALIYAGELAWRAAWGAPADFAVGAAVETGPIVISAPLLAQWASEHEAAGRPFDDAARQARIDQYVEQEALLREARLMGLEREDLIVRRRLLQKMRFLLEDLADIPEPYDADLQAWLDARPDKYRRAARVSLTHRFFSADRRPGGQARRDAQRALEVLGRGQRQGRAVEADLSDGEVVRGDPFVLGASFKRRTQAQLTRTFGEPFAEAAMALAPGQWRGPIRSSYGQHLVLVGERTVARDATLEEARAEVLTDWLADARRRAAQAAIAGLIERHGVRVDDGDAQNASPRLK